jgi:hypothetical protein
LQFNAELMLDLAGAQALGPQLANANNTHAMNELRFEKELFGAAWASVGAIVFRAGRLSSMAMTYRSPAAEGSQSRDRASVPSTGQGGFVPDRRIESKLDA